MSAGAQERLGTVLRGKYHLDRILGEGGMAVVYEATHRNRARFAVKVLHATLSHNAEARSRFLREGYAANSVGHPGAVLVVDEDVAEDGSAFLVMELLDGMGCEELWKRMDRRLAPELASAILLQVLDVLVAAHAHGIVHRDIKPANLFLMRSGAVKILDFGIARAREVMLSATATSSGVTLGTPAFMSPEQASGKARELDGRTDVWSAAATYFTLVSGEFVHASAESALLLLVAASTSPPRSIATADSRVPPAIVAVIDRALALRPEERWPTAESMRDALVEAYRSSFGSASPEEVVASAVRSHVGMRVSAAAFAPTMQPAVITGSPTSSDRRSDEQRGGGTASSVFFVSQPERRRGPSWLQATAAAIGLAAGLGVAMWVVKGSRGSAPGPSATASLAAVGPPVSAAPLPPLAPLAPPPTSAEPVPPTTAPPAVLHPATASPAPRAAVRPAPATSAKASCDPNWYIDAAGIKKYKAECL